MTEEGEKLLNPVPEQKVRGFAFCQNPARPGQPSKLCSHRAGRAAAQGIQAGKLQKRWADEALDFVRNSRKAPHLPSTHTQAHTPPRSRCPETQRPEIHNHLKKLPAPGKQQLEK